MSYLTSLVLVSAVAFIAERLRPARPAQPARRAQLGGDLGWLVINGWLASAASASGTAWIASEARRLASAAGFVPETSWLSDRPLLLQVLVLFVAADFLQWCVHLALHRFPLLWEFHKLHHSIRDMDWVGNYRFHWMELVVYGCFLFVPLSLWLGPSPQTLLIVAVGSTVWGNLNHANIDVDLGSLGYVLNSPRMHLWHHDASGEGRQSKNYGVVLSLWDWIFGTAYWPRDRAPLRLGYEGDEEIPSTLWRQVLYPLTRQRPG